MTVRDDRMRPDPDAPAPLNVEPPASEAELLTRAHGLAGQTLAELAAPLGRTMPADQRRAKGLVGTLVERHLGADAASRAEPDFVGLSIELKTLPLQASHRPKESTFVCSIAPDQIVQVPWLQSRVWKKLRRVLWVPVEADPSIPLALRRVGRAFLWSPDETQRQTLQADWEDLRDLIARGDVDQVTAHLGQALQIRPKAAHGGVRQRTRDDNGAPIHSLPRGFYLRARFTATLLPSLTDPHHG